MNRYIKPTIEPRGHSEYHAREINDVNSRRGLAAPITRYVPEAYYHREAGALEARPILLPGHNATAETYILAAASALNLPAPVIMPMERDEPVQNDSPLIDVNESPIAPDEPESKKRKLSLLLPGHNEELIIALTIQSAIAAGQDIQDIYVVDDNSDDKTRKIAVGLLGKDHVLSVKRSGKALAVKKGIKKFNIEERYEWVHVADADSVFSPDYFRIYKEKLTDEYVVAIGFVQSLRGNWISTYRAISYTYGQQVFRRIQSALGMVSVFPGPVTSFRTDILKHIEINASNVAEDFDMTLQVHRKNLGKVVYIPKAVNYTQDPQSFHDFCKQSMRWYRGFFQGIMQHRIGLHGQRIDVSIGFQLLQTAIFFLQITLLVPFIVWYTNNWTIPFIALSIDFLITGIITVAASVLTKRWYLLGAMPYFYFLRVAEIVMYFSAFFEVFLLHRLSDSAKGWSTEGRRYKLNTIALQDVVK